jgi:oligopeptide/dipeptide ABC transporter ATP-binding protein
MTDAGVVLAMEDVTHVYAGQGGALRRAPAIRAVDRVSLSLAAGETLAVVGESGCGKSTLARLLVRLLTPAAGRLAYRGQDYTTASGAALRAVRRRVQMVFQDPYGSLSPRRTTGQIIAEPLEAYDIVRSAAERRARVDALLRAVGLAPEHAARLPAEFSGGQRQRIGIARALAVEPEVIVADEPVSALDVSVQAQIINLFQDLQAARGLAYLFIAHDLAVVRHIAHRVAVMYLGRIVEIGPKAQLYAAPQHPYTHALLTAVPRPEPGRPRDRVVLEGDLPSPASIIEGCAFASRCPLAQPRCRAERPELRPVAEGQLAACHFARPLPLAGARRA